MNKVKSFLYLSFSCTALTALTMFSTPASADEISIKSQQIPESSVELVKEKWVPLTSNMLLADHKNINDYYLGTPFTMGTDENDSYNYPIVNKGNKDIEYTIEVSKEDTNFDNAVISSNKAEYINDLSESVNSSLETPVEFEMGTALLKYKQNDKWHDLFNKKLKEDAVKSNNYDSHKNTSVIEATKELASVNEADSKGLNPNVIQKILPFAVSETQGALPICYEYCLSQTINYQRGNRDWTAVKLVKAIYPDITDEQIADGSYPRYVEDALNFIDKTYNQKLIFEKEFKGFETLKKEIDTNAPATIDLKNLDDESSAGHSIVNVGYTTPADGNIEEYPPYYHYWNPWWDKFIMVSSNSSYLTLENTRYKPFRTTYNFRIPKASSLNSSDK